MVREMAKVHAHLWFMLLALPAILSIGGGSTTLILAQQVPQYAEITEFFDGIKEDRTKVTWAHGVNSRKQLKDALDGDAMMLEADVVMGKVSDAGMEEPIMAHPPAKTSDMNLTVFMMEVEKAVKDQKKKGVKLDFKTEEAFNKSVAVLKELQIKTPFPVWLNADILEGPMGGVPGVSPEVFLNTSRDSFPKAGLSVGWTTNSSTNDATCYTNDQLKKVVEQLRKAGLAHAENVTLAVRAVFTARCASELQRLLEEDLPKATVTIWHSEKDNVTIQPLHDFVNKVKKDRVYLDLPEKLRKEIMNGDGSKNSSSRVGSIASLIVLPLIVAVCRLQ